VYSYRRDIRRGGERVSKDGLTRMTRVIAMHGVSPLLLLLLFGFLTISKRRNASKRRARDLICLRLAALIVFFWKMF